MKNILGVCTLLGGLFLLGSCSGEAKSEVKEEAYSYSYDAESTILEWTAFKFTNKTGVKGTFNDIKVTSLSSSTDRKALVESLGFNIKTSTVESNDEGRNAKIAEFFFGAINTESIDGKILKLKDDGTADISVKMNGITKTISGEYTLTETQFSFHSTIDVVDWKAENGIVKLNEQCIDNHKGEDGVTKLWSEVELSFSTVFKREEVK